MRNFVARLRSGAAIGSVAIVLCTGLSQPVLAQEQQKEPETQKIDEQAAGGVANISAETPGQGEIVVTGTLIRGAAPVGSNLIAVGQEKLVSTGATSSNELLATIPQVTNYFNRVPSADLSIAVNQIQVSRPNIRNISPRNASSSATLILVDGHRIASAGVNQASVDPDVIPTGAIERVEVVTEGGSATYGADAVAGVINFITRKRFDGAQLEARYGFADNYSQFDANATVGKDWGSGSAYVSYTYTKNSALFGRDRDFIRGLNYASQPYAPLGRQCDQANVTLPGRPGTTYAVQNLTSPGFNACDTTDDATFVPEVERHGAVGSLYQELSENTTISLRAFFSRRETLNQKPARGSVSVPATNFYYRPVASNPTAAQTVDFSFGPALGNESAPSGTLTQEWGANAELTQKLAGNWQLRGLFNYSHTNSSFYLVEPNVTRLTAAGAGTTAATAINPYNIAATNRSVLADILDNQIAGEAKDDLLDLRAILDGTLFTMPGGDVRLAVGYEFMNDRYQQRYQSGIRRGTLATFPFTNYSRQVHSLFGEVNVPIVGESNATPGIHSLVISASGRYDHYSDFGSTVNPKVGVTYKPVEWLALRGNWGTSFTAPTPLDQLGSLRNTLTAFPFVAFTRPGDVLPGGTILCCQTLALQGSSPNLQPQTAQTWSLGFDVDPPFMTGLHASFSYYNVKFENILATPTANVGIFTDFPANVTTSTTGLTTAYLNTLRALAPNASASIDAALAAGRPIYEFVDFRTGNLGIVKVTGLDFAVNYRHELGFGSVDMSVNGNYQLSRKSQVSPGAPVVDVLLTENPRLALQAVVGANIGYLRAQATWNHTSGYAINPTSSVPVQTRVGAFSTVNLFFKYDVPGDSMLLKDVSLTLNINNVLDQDPPVLLRNDQNENGYANGFTLGRLVQFGVSKKF